MAKLLVNTQYPREIFETNWKGEIVHTSQSETINLEVTSCLASGDAELYFRNAVRVPKKVCTHKDDAQRKAIGFMLDWLPGRVAATSYIDFYGIQWINYEGSAVADGDGVVRHSEIEMAITDALAQSIKAAWEHNEAVRARFIASKERLTDLAFNNTPYGFQATVGEARQCLNSVAEVLACSAALGGYSDTEARSALRSYEELARRKVATNHNYQVLLSELQRFAMGVGFPEVWGRRPPLRQR